MKAAVTTGKLREITLQEVPIPELRPGKILLKTAYCSVCGTDLEYLDNTLAYRKGGALHAGAILGHEYSAVVAEVGEGVTGFEVGDRVTGSGLWDYCGECYFCRRGMVRMCLGKEHERSVYTQVPEGGYGNRNGAMAEYMLRSPSQLMKLPDEVSGVEGSLMEPLMVATGSVQAAELTIGDTVVVIGTGKIGLGVIGVAKASGASRVIGVDVHAHRLQTALRMGADVVLNPQKIDLVSEVVRMTGAGPDVVIICVRDSQVLDTAVDMIRRGGKIVIVGQIPPTEVNPGMWLVKKLRIEAVLGGPPWIIPLNLVASGRVDLTPMISEVIPLAEAQRAFDDLWSGKNVVSMLKP